MKEFLSEFSVKPDPIMTECVNAAYQNTLRQYHNWVVRGIFSLAVRSLPLKDDFLKGLAVKPDDYINNKPTFEKQVYYDINNAKKTSQMLYKMCTCFCQQIKDDMKCIASCMHMQLEIIKKFYIDRNLDV